jgi:hypothetical protein
MGRLAVSLGSFGPRSQAANRAMTKLENNLLLCLANGEPIGFDRKEQSSKDGSAQGLRRTTGGFIP